MQVRIRWTSPIRWKSLLHIMLTNLLTSTLMMEITMQTCPTPRSKSLFSILTWIISTIAKYQVKRKPMSSKIWNQCILQIRRLSKELVLTITILAKSLMNLVIWNTQERRSLIALQRGHKSLAIQKYLRIGRTLFRASKVEWIASMIRLLTSLAWTNWKIYLQIEILSKNLAMVPSKDLRVFLHS